MNEARYTREMRLRAVRHLPEDFPNQVIRDARARNRRSQRNRLTVITAAICVALAVAVHWTITARTNATNLEMWSKAANQIAALEQTI
jgi:hypothetical protein